jgi:hypothetical protein
MRSGGGRRALGVGALALALLLGVTCSRDEPSCPHAAYGYIVGRVTTGGLPATSTLRFDANWGIGSRATFYRSVVANGSFEAVVAPGDYYLRLEGPNQERYDYSPDGVAHRYTGESAAIRVADGDTARADFSFGSLVVDVAVPSEVDWREVSMTASWGGRAGFRSPSVTVRPEWSDGLARFRYPILPSGSIALAARVPSGWDADETVWLPGTHRPEQAESVQVAVGGLTRHSVVLPQHVATIRGEVVGSWQRMQLTHPFVSLLADDSLAIVAKAISGSDGAFEVPLVIPEPVRVLVSLGGNERWIGGESFATATRFDPQAWSITDVGRLEESGLLLELITPAPRVRGGFGVELVRPGETEPARTLWLDYDPATNLVGIPSIEPGTYLMRFDNSRMQMNWVGQWYDRAAGVEAATQVTIPSGGAVVPLAVQLEPGGSLSGSVPSDSLSDPRDFVIYVADAQRRETVGRIYECEPCSCYGSPFRFTARGLPDGSYRVGALVGDHCPPPWAAPPETIWYPGTTDWDSAGVVTIVNHAAVTGLEIHLP